MKKHSLHSVPKAATGFTLIELLVTLTMAGILAAIAIPNLQDFIRNNRLTAAANDFLRSAQVARTEAIKRQQTVIVCASTNTTALLPTCSSGSFSTGWVVFQDTNGNWQADAGDIVIEKHAPLDPTITVRNDGTGLFNYLPQGFQTLTQPPAGPVRTTSVVICDARGNQTVGTNSTARAAFIDANSGRARVSSTSADVGTALTATFPATCP